MGKAWHGMKWIRTSTRLALYAACGFRCAYCGRDAARSGKPGTFGLDHLVPREMGGSNAPENLAMACKGCNGRKGTRTLETWLDALASDGQDVSLIKVRLYRRGSLDRSLGRTLASAWGRGASLATLAKQARATS